MRHDAEAHADEDKKRKELIEARNYADNTAYTAEKTLRELGDKVPADLKDQVETKVKEVKDLMNKDDADVIRKAADDLGQVLQKVGAAAYTQPGEPAAGGPGDQGGPTGEAQPGGPSNAPGGEDVVDGEFHSAG